MVGKWENAVKMVGAISSEGFSSQGPPLHVRPFFPLIISSLLPSLSVMMAGLNSFRLHLETHPFQAAFSTP